MLCGDKSFNTRIHLRSWSLVKIGTTTAQKNYF